jgi:hypothetical protein
MKEKVVPIFFSACVVFSKAFGLQRKPGIDRPIEK